jgi:hypothetical protein
MWEHGIPEKGKQRDFGIIKNIWANVLLPVDSKEITAKKKSKWY